MPGGAPCRAGDREAEDPETPPCEGGLSAASAVAGKPAEATASGVPDRLFRACPIIRQRCRPTSRRLMSAPLCREGWRTLGLNVRGCQGLFSPLPNGREPAPAKAGVESRGRRDRVRDRSRRRSLLNLLPRDRSLTPTPLPLARG